jgi:hypothetical protein
MRAAAAAFHDARDAWEKIRSRAAREAAMNAGIAAIDRHPVLRGHYADFARDILTWLAVPIPNPA